MYVTRSVLTDMAITDVDVDLGIVNSPEEDV